MGVEFRPLAFIAQAASAAHPQAVLLILNTRVPGLATLQRLWQNANYHICADGGANRLYDLFDGIYENQRPFYLPQRVHGDLDSLRPDVRQYYEARGVTITQDHDQESTDFGKAIKEISLHSSLSAQRDVLVLGSLSGRVDQGLGLLSEIHREQCMRETLRFWLFSESSISFITERGHNLVHCPIASGLITRSFGIIPIYGPAIISTKGLEWDVKDWYTRMGENVSTSNHIQGEQVELWTTARVLVTIERAEGLTE